MAGSFQERVWIALAKNIGPGQTVSYGELAKMVNCPGLYLFVKMWYKLGSVRYCNNQKL